MRKMPAVLTVAVLLALAWLMTSCAQVPPLDLPEAETENTGPEEGVSPEDNEVQIDDEEAGHGGGADESSAEAEKTLPGDGTGPESDSSGGASVERDALEENSDFAMATGPAEKHAVVNTAGAPSTTANQTTPNQDSKTENGEEPPEPGTLAYIAWKRAQERKPAIDSWVFNDDDESGRWWDIDTGPRGFEHFVFID